MLNRVGDRLLMALDPSAIAFLDVDLPGSAARTCGPLEVLSAAQTTVRVGNQLMVTGTTSRLAGGLVEWLDVVED